MREIHSFLEVDIPENTLVLCDIDDTLLRYYKTLNDCYNDVLETIESMSQHREFGDDFKTTTLANKERILEIAKIRYQHHQQRLRHQSPLVRPQTVNQLKILWDPTQCKNQNQRFKTFGNDSLKQQ